MLAGPLIFTLVQTQPLFYFTCNFSAALVHQQKQLKGFEFVYLELKANAVAPVVNAFK